MLGGDWSVGTNWEFGLVPGSTDTTQITLPGNYTVSITSHVSAASLVINAIGATLTESSAGSVTPSGGLSLYNGVISLNGANSFGGAVARIGDRHVRADGRHREHEPSAARRARRA